MSQFKVMITRTSTEEFVGQLTPIKKAAILCIALGESFAQQVMQRLSEREQERLTLAIAQLGVVPPEIVEQVVTEYNELLRGAQLYAEGGIDYARKILVATLGEARANEILRRVQKELDDHALGNLRRADPEQLRTLLRGEHPQIIALILANLDPRQAAAVVGGFEPDFGAEVLYRVATMDKVSPELLETVERSLGNDALQMMTEMSRAGGPAAVAEVLNNITGTLEKELLSRIAERDADLSQAIKDMMFVFEDIVRLSDRDLRKVLTEADRRDLALAFKTASDAVKTKILSNMSQRAKEALDDEMDILGPVKLRDVDAAQARIITLIRQMEERGEIEISMGGDRDEIIY